MSREDAAARLIVSHHARSPRGFSPSRGSRFERTGWDSNPRYAFTYTHFPGVRLKPLGHPSLLVPALKTNGAAGCYAPPRRTRSTGHGQGEIRTLDTVAGMPVFETGAFNHSATCPGDREY